MSKRILLLMVLLLSLSAASPALGATPPAPAPTGRTALAATGATSYPWQVILDILSRSFLRRRPDPVRIEFWHTFQPGSSPDRALQQLVKQYNDSQRETEVIPVSMGNATALSQVLTRIDPELRPGVILAPPSNLVPLASSGEITPLDALFPAAERADYLPNLLTAYTYDGKLYGLPFNQTASILIYDKTAVPAAPRTWEEFRATAQQVSSPTFYGTAFNGDVYDFGLFLRQAGGDWFKDGRAAFHDAAGVQALTYMSDFVSSRSALQLKPGEYATNLFNEGRLAMVLTTSAVLPSIKPASGHSWGAAPLPAGPINNHGQLGGSGLAIPAGLTPQQSKAAAQFMLWLTSPETTVEWAMNGTGYLPVRKSALTDTAWLAYTKANPTFGVAADALVSAQPMPNHLQWNNASRAITAVVQKSLLGNYTPKMGLKEAADQVNALMAK